MNPKLRRRGHQSHNRLQPVTAINLLAPPGQCKHSQRNQGNPSPVACRRYPNPKPPRNFLHQHTASPIIMPLSATPSEPLTRSPNRFVTLRLANTDLLCTSDCCNPPYAPQPQTVTSTATPGIKRLKSVGQRSGLNAVLPRAWMKGRLDRPQDSP